jgi:prepilin-type N-terminal cleavage/methylation domain-containing protein
MKTSRHPGFTLVELLIVIAIIGVLMGLLLPAIQAARERTRQTQCTNNQKNLGVAMQSYVTTGKGTFPGWAEDQKLGSGNVIAISWAAKLLGNLDEQTIRDQMLSDSGAFDYAAPPKLSIFTCPSNAATNPNLGTLDFVVNSGLPDSSLVVQNKPDNKAHGICHDLRAGMGGPKVRAAGDIPDGSKSTFLISENIHKDARIGGFDSTWLGPINSNIQPVAAASYTPTRADSNINPEQRFGMGWVDVNFTGWPAVDDLYPINQDEKGGNYSELGARGRNPFMRPSGAHPELFIAGFCDGSTKSISSTIEYRVYQQLMTPAGAKADIQDPVVRFMVPPLSDSDF